MLIERPRDRKAFFIVLSQERPPTSRSVYLKYARYLVKELVPY